MLLAVLVPQRDLVRTGLGLDIDRVVAGRIDCRIALAVDAALLLLGAGPEGDTAMRRHDQHDCHGACGAHDDAEAEGTGNPHRSYPRSPSSRDRVTLPPRLRTVVNKRMYTRVSVQ